MRKLIFIIILFYIQSTQAQEPFSINISNKEELPDVEFYDILEDNKGFVWLAAEKGLYRYDGKKFIQYIAKNQRGLSLFRLKEDAQGRVWCTNLTGQIFYTKGEELIEFIDVKELALGRLVNFTLAGNQMKLVASTGVYSINLLTKEIEVIKKTSKLIVSVDICEGDEGTTYYLLKDLYRDKGGKLEKIQTLGVLKQRFFTIDGNIYLIGDKIKNREFTSISSIYQYNFKKNRFIQLVLPKDIVGKFIVAILKVGDDFWVCTSKGTFKIAIQNNVISIIDRYFEEDFITKVIKDKNANYWFTTLNNGVYVVPDLHIASYLKVKNKAKITAFIIVKDHMIYGLDNGEIFVKELSSQKTFSFKIPKRKIVNFAYSKNFNSLLISLDLKSILWNLNTNTLHKINRFGNARKISFQKNNLLFSGPYVSVVIDLKQIFNSIKNTGSFVMKPPRFHKTTFNVEKGIFKKKKPYSHIFNPDGTFFYTGIDGLFWADQKRKKSREFQRITYEGKPVYGFDFTRTTDGVTWLSTLTNGVYGIKNQQVIAHLDEDDGLRGIKALHIKAERNNLWTSSSKGIEFVDRQKGNYKVKQIPFLNKSILSKIVNIELYQDQIFIAGNKEIIQINTKKVSYAKPMQDVYLTSVIIGNTEKKIAKTYTLDYKNRGIEIGFNTNGFNVKDKVYKYRLKGVENTWKYTSENLVKYTLLPYGKFEFEVQTLAKESIPIYITIHVKKPFWKRWWFVSLVLLFSIGLIHLFYKSKLIKNELEQLELIEKERIKKELLLSQLENLRSQMNPHFIFNALNSIQEYILTNEKYLASSFLSEFSTLIRMYLKYSKQEEIRLSEELEMLKIYLNLEKNRFTDFEYEIQLDNTISTTEISIPCFLIQPFIENAIKHGLMHKQTNRKLKISFTEEVKGKLQIAIIDNGVGRARAMELSTKNHESFSTQANEDRVELINLNKTEKITVEIIDLYDENNKGKGTQVIILIPYNDEGFNH